MNYTSNVRGAFISITGVAFAVHLRVSGSKHPLMHEYGIDAVRFQHPQIHEWRENAKGVRYHHAPTNLIVWGAVDDLWGSPDGEIIVVDYKATAKSGDVTIDAEWQLAYKRQMEVYQWLVRQQRLAVSTTSYFVYCNGQDAEAFDGHPSIYGHRQLGRRHFGYFKELPYGR